MTCSDVTLCSWNSPAPLAGNTGIYLSRSESAKQSDCLQNSWTDAGTCVHCPLDEPLWPETWSSALLTQWASISQNVIDKAVGQWKKRLRASMKAKGHHFEHLLNWNQLLLEPTTNTLHNRLFSEPPTVYQGKHVVSRHFRRSYLKANKVSKGDDGIRKLEHAYHF